MLRHATCQNHTTFTPVLQRHVARLGKQTLDKKFNALCAVGEGMGLRLPRDVGARQRQILGKQGLIQFGQSGTGKPFLPAQTGATGGKGRVDQRRALAVERCQGFVTAFRRHHPESAVTLRQQQCLAQAGTHTEHCHRMPEIHHTAIQRQQMCCHGRTRHGKCSGFQVVEQQHPGKAELMLQCSGVDDPGQVGHAAVGVCLHRPGNGH